MLVLKLHFCNRFVNRLAGCVFAIYLITEYPLGNDCGEPDSNTDRIIKVSNVFSIPLVSPY